MWYYVKILKDNYKVPKVIAHNFFTKNSAKLHEQVFGIIDCKHSTMKLGLRKWYCYVICLVGCKFHGNHKNLHLLPYEKELIAMKKRICYN